MMEFRKFSSIPRLIRPVSITEKIDGTNALIAFDEDLNMQVGSRNRWITPEKDNMGFARWAYEHDQELKELGPGFHYGEWWGSGIQRRYGLTEKRFSLFNRGRWNEGNIPSCCHVVPVVCEGTLSLDLITEAVDLLMEQGSLAAPGFMSPEGIVIYHTASGGLFKYTFDGDGHKSMSKKKGDKK